MINIVSTVTKGAVGLLVGSQVLVADAVHSLTDCVSFGINYADESANRDLTFLQSALIGAIMFLCGVWILADNMYMLTTGTLARPGILGLIVASFSTLANFRLFKISECANNSKPGEQNIFLCMVQNKVNFFSSCLAVGGILLADIGLVVLDPICAIFIGILQLRGAKEIFQQIYTKQRPAPYLFKRLALLVSILSCFIIGFFVHTADSTLSSREVVLVPSQGTTAESQAESILGRAPYFIIINSSKLTFIPFSNTNRNAAGSVSADFISFVKQQKVGVILAHSIGEEMFTDLRSAGITMYYFDQPGTVADTFERYTSRQLEIATTSNVAKGFGKHRFRWLRPW